MVGQWPPPGLCSFSTERRRSVDMKTTRELRISAAKHDERGWMSENYLSSPAKGEVFSLDTGWPVLLLRVPRFVSRAGCIIQGSTPGLSVVLFGLDGKSPPRASCFNLLISRPGAAPWW